MSYVCLTLGLQECSRYLALERHCILVLRGLYLAPIHILRGQIMIVLCDVLVNQSMGRTLVISSMTRFSPSLYVSSSAATLSTRSSRILHRRERVRAGRERAEC